MTRIQEASLHPYSAPLERAYVSATATHETRDGLILQIKTEDGTPGLGEAAPLSNRTEPLEQARQALAQALHTLGEETLDLQDALDGVDDLLADPAATPTARYALETAILDALTRSTETPLSRHLAAEHETPATVPQAVPVNDTIPAMDPQATGDKARQASNRGYDTIKLKATGSWEDDRRRVEQARANAGSANLRLDVNGAWEDPDTALDRLKTLAPYELEYIEQPLPPEAIPEMARLREASPVPVAADEPLTTLDAIDQVLDANAADVLVLKPMVLGGLQRVLQAHAQATDAGVPVVVTSTIDGAIGRAAALHAAAALGERPLACGLATGDLFEREPTAYDERIHHGRLLVPTSPGHGAWINEPLEAL